MHLEIWPGVIEAECFAHPSWQGIGIRNSQPTVMQVNEYGNEKNLQAIRQNLTPSTQISVFIETIEQEAGCDEIKKLLHLDI